MQSIFQLLANFGTTVWSVVYAALGIIFTALVGSSIARSWQMRNWITQQRTADREKINSETKKLFDDFMNLASKRHFRTRRLYWAIKSNKLEKVQKEVEAYDNALVEWNESELSWNVRFIKNLSDGTKIVEDIDRRIRVPFVEVGRRLEMRIKELRLGHATKVKTFSAQDCHEIESQLTALGRAIFETGRTIYTHLEHVDSQRLDNDNYVKVAIQRGNYDELSVWQLLQATLKSKRKRKFIE